MTTNKPNVQRYDNMGCPEEICRVDMMYESGDGDYVSYEDYEVLQVECEKLRKASEHYVKHSERLEEALREAQPFIGWIGSYDELHAKIEALLDHEKESNNV